MRAAELKPGANTALLLREASAEPCDTTELERRLTKRHGVDLPVEWVRSTASYLARYGYLDRPARGLYVITAAGEAELDRLFEEAELATWTATLTPAPAPADARRTA